MGERKSVIARERREKEIGKGITGGRGERERKERSERKERKERERENLTLKICSDFLRSDSCGYLRVNQNLNLIQ
jgi:hypothetical protein